MTGVTADYKYRVSLTPSLDQERWGAHHGSAAEGQVISPRGDQEVRWCLGRGDYVTPQHHPKLLPGTGAAVRTLKRRTKTKLRLAVL